MARAGVRRPGPRSGITRRRFLKLAGLAGGAGALAACTRVVAPVTRRARVVIVGAGIAGLRCATVLGAHGVGVTLYEASDRVGGRIRTLRGYFVDGRAVERGGEFISSEHRAIRRLAEELGLVLEVVSGGSVAGGDDVFWVDGRRYPVAEANRDWAAVHPRFAAALREAPWPQRFDSHTPGGVALDHRSVPEWIEENVPGGVGSRLGRLLLTTTIAEYGGEPEEQPALNLVYLLAWNAPGTLQPLAGTDERYHVAGGNDQLVTELARRLPAGTIETGAELVAVATRPDDAVTCTFRRDTAVFDVVADHAVFAIPFTTLRRVDLGATGWSPTKLRAIASLGMADHGKLHVELTRRPWIAAGLGGSVVTDPEGFQECWDETSAVAGPGGIVVDLRDAPAWEAPSAPTSGPPPAAVVDGFLSELDEVFPGVAGAATGRAWWDRWAAHPWSLGSYSRYELGQITTFATVEGRAEGNAHFCGEHTSIEFQGYMEGAVATGERAAREVLRALA